MKISELINERIKNKLSELGKEVGDMCYHVGITTHGYKGMIKEGSIKASTLEKIANYLKVPASYFFENSPTSYEVGEVDDNILQDGSINYNKMETKELIEQMATITEVLTKRLQENKQDNV